MGPNISRYSIDALGPESQREVDEYKARSVWGTWWALGDEMRDRFFSREEQRWIRRYGARLDAIACMVDAPRSDAEKQFQRTCQGAAPRTDRERLWLRVQVVCRYQVAVDRAARLAMAEHLAEARGAEVASLVRINREAEEVAMELLEEVRRLGGDEDALHRRSIRNVEWTTCRFRLAPRADAPRFDVVRPDTPRARPAVQTFPPNLAPASQG